MERNARVLDCSVPQWKLTVLVPCACLSRPGHLPSQAHLLGLFDCKPGPWKYEGPISVGHVLFWLASVAPWTPWPIPIHFPETKVWLRRSVAWLGCATDGMLHSLVRRPRRVRIDVGNLKIEKFNRQTQKVKVKENWGSKTRPRRDLQGSSVLFPPRACCARDPRGCAVGFLTTHVELLAQWAERRTSGPNTKQAIPSWRQQGQPISLLSRSQTPGLTSFFLLVNLNLLHPDILPPSSPHTLHTHFPPPSLEQQNIDIVVLQQHKTAHRCRPSAAASHLCCIPAALKLSPPSPA